MIVKPVPMIVKTVLRIVKTVLRIVNSKVLIVGECHTLNKTLCTASVAGSARRAGLSSFMNEQHSCKNVHTKANCEGTVATTERTMHLRGQTSSWRKGTKKRVAYSISHRPTTQNNYQNLLSLKTFILQCSVSFPLFCSRTEI